MLIDKICNASWKVRHYDDVQLSSFMSNCKRVFKLDEVLMVKHLAGSDFSIKGIPFAYVYVG